jgi:hypothetical protein
MARFFLNAVPGAFLVAADSVNIKSSLITKEEEEQVCKDLQAGIIESAIGHQALADQLTEILGVEITFNRRTNKLEEMLDEEQILAVWTGERLAEGQILTKEELQGRIKL